MDKKRFLKFLAIAVLILSTIVTIVYFSIRNSSDSPIELEVWFTYEGGEIIKEKIASFENLHPDISIKFNEQPSSGWVDKFVSVAQTGESPDVFLAKGAWFGELASLGYIYSLTNFISPTLESSFLPFSIASLTYENELWGLPLWLDSILLFYNKDLFNQNNLEYPTANWTENDLIFAAHNLTDSLESQRYGLAWSALSPYMWPAFQYGYGHGPLYQNQTIIVNDTASVSAMEFIYNLKYYYECVDYDDSSSAATQAFLESKASMLIYGGWFVPVLKDEGFNYGIEILPKISSTGEFISPMAEVKGFGISKDTLYPDTCFELISYLTSTETQQELVNEEYKIPTKNDLILSSTVQNNPDIKKQIEQISHSQIYPLDPIYAIYSDYIRAALQFIMIDHQDIQETLNEAQQNIDANRGVGD